MSQSTMTSPPQTQPIAASGLDYGAAFEIGRHIIDRWTRGIFACEQELAMFGMARFTRDFEAWSALARCKNVGEILQCQTDFAQRATAEYSAEADKLLELMTNVAGQVLTMGQEGAVAGQAQQANGAKAAEDVTPLASAPASATQTQRRAPSRA